MVVCSLLFAENNKTFIVLDVMVLVLVLEVLVYQEMISKFE